MKEGREPCSVVGCTKPASWALYDDEGCPSDNDSYSCDEHLSLLLSKHTTVLFLGEEGTKR